jgi:LCP family protein required for cell wall assembly
LSDQGVIKFRRTFSQRLIIAVNLVLIAGCLATAGGITYAYSKVSSIGRIQGIGGALSPLDESGPSRAENILIVGTDSGAGLDPNDPVLIGRPGGVRSDTIMVLRLDPAQTQAQLLSLPRDLYVPIAGSRGSDRINSAIQGGPSVLIDTIKNDFGIPINHYIEINFFAFRSIVSAVDGVPMYFPTPARDRKTGLDVEQPGCTTLDPVQALAFARSRAYEYFENGRWKTDPTGDFGRISRQQEFIRRVIRRAIDKGARNPLVLNDLISAGTSALNLDPTLTPSDILDIGERFRDFNPDNLVTYSVPVTEANIRGGAVLLLRTGDAEPIFDIFRGVDANAPDSILLVVQNGTPTSNMASTAADELRKAGFSIPADYTSNAERFDFQQTTIRYLPGAEERARQVASYLVTTPAFEEVPFLVQSNVSVVIGTDWQGVLDTPGPLPDLPTTTSSTTSTTVRPGRTTTTTTTTTVPGQPAGSTTTTVLGVVPTTPEDVRC